MANQAITLGDLKTLGRRIDSEMIHAPHLDGPGGLYEALAKYGDADWVTLRAPVWIGNQLVVMVVRPRVDDEDDATGPFKPLTLNVKPLTLHSGFLPPEMRTTGFGPLLESNDEDCDEENE